MIPAVMTAVEPAAAAGADPPVQALAGHKLEFGDLLGYLADRRYSPRTVRAYAFDLLVLLTVGPVSGVVVIDGSWPLPPRGQ